MSKVKLDTNLTVLLPLKDRVQYTARFLTYYNAISCPFKVLIADGGNNQEVRRILRGNTELSKLHYQYVEYPYDKSLKTYHAKMADIVEKIDTPYTMVMDNDDFFFINGVYENMNFLFSNSDYASSRGSVNIFDVDGKVYGNMSVGQCYEK